MSNIIEYVEPNELEKLFKEEKIKEALNRFPPQKWVKQHPFVKSHYYLPIDKVEYLLDKIYKKYRIEVKKTGMLMNSVEVTVRVWYRDLQSGEMEYHDGVGACELQTQKDTGNLKGDMSNVNRGAVAMALPIAKTVAVKDACDHLGNIFGRNINRKDTLPYEADDKVTNKLAEQTIAKIDKAGSQEEIDKILDSCPKEIETIVKKQIHAKN